MASIVSVMVSDDIDGSPKAETVTFGLEGITYEIDLSDKNRAKLDRALAPFIEHSRRLGRARRRSGSSPQRDRSREESTAIRMWARERGLNVSDRGRISVDVIRQYEEAH